MGKLQRAILRVLLEGSRYPGRWDAVSFGELCERTRPEGRRPGTHKNAVSRAVWSLTEQGHWTYTEKGGWVGLVEVWTLLWVPVRRQKQPAEVNAQWFRDHAVLGLWYGGRRPRIRRVALTQEGEEWAKLLAAES
jgi:hypothetical protein